MTEIIRSWPDSGFYISSAGTQNALEQFTKLQTIAKLGRALSDASTVDTNGDKLQDVLTGLSLGNLTQRHKWRVLYDTTNDRFLVQRNTGTDAAKVWAERFRIDASGNVTVTGTVSTTGITITSSGLTLTGDLDVNDFYVRNAEDIFTNDLRVGNNLTLKNNHEIGWVYIQSKTASSSPVIDFTGLTHYSRYRIEFDQIRPSADGGIFLMQISTNNGATYLGTSIYSSSGLANTNFGAGTQEQISTGTASAWQIFGDTGVNQDNAAGSALTGHIQINSLGSATLQCRARAQCEFVETNGLFSTTADVGLFATPGAVVNALRFVYFTGVITSGTFRLYGLRGS
jgi:hypothetical protein